jgi:geranylgeranylglycerol-phosphate geranylgeranyltransferase
MPMIIAYAKAVADLGRLGNMLVATFAVWVGGVVGADTFDPVVALLGGLAAGLTTAWGNSVNDIFDREIDAHQKQTRPIPSGRLTLKSARVWSIVFVGCGAFVAAYISEAAFVVVVGVSLALGLYSWKLKAVPIIGHLMVAFLGGLTFLFGAIVQGTWWSAIYPQGWIAFGFATLWHLARELVKAAEDVESDQKYGAVTFAVWAGTKAACRGASILLALLALLLTPPYLLGFFNLTYLVLVSVGVVPLLLGAAAYLWTIPDTVRLSQIASLLKWNMLVGICAIWFGLS